MLRLSSLRPVSQRDTGLRKAGRALVHPSVRQRETFHYTHHPQDLTHQIITTRPKTMAHSRPIHSGTRHVLPSLRNHYLFPSIHSIPYQLSPLQCSLKADLSTSPTLSPLLPPLPRPPFHPPPLTCDPCSRMAAVVEERKRVVVDAVRVAQRPLVAVAVVLVDEDAVLGRVAGHRATVGARLEGGGGRGGGGRGERRRGKALGRRISMWKLACICCGFQRRMSPSVLTATRRSKWQ